MYLLFVKCNNTMILLKILLFQKPNLVFKYQADN